MAVNPLNPEQVVRASRSRLVEAKYSSGAIERSQSILATASGVLYQLQHRPDGLLKFSFISGGSRNLFEREAAEIQANAQRLLALIHSEDAERFQHTLAESAHSLQLWQWEGRFLLPSGQTIWIQTASQPQLQPNGEILWDGFLIPVTRDRPSPQLELTSKFLLTVINETTDPIFIKDRQHRWVLLNDAFCKFVGYERSQLLGKSDLDFFPKTQADQFLVRDELVFTTGTAAEDEEYLTDARGKTFTISTKKNLIQDEAGHLFLVGTIRDITPYKKIAAELRQSQQLLQLVMDNIPQGIFWKDLNSVYQGCNANFARVVGVKPAAIVGMTDYNLPSQVEEADRYRDCDRRVMESDRPELGIVELQHQADGQQWLETNKLPLHDAAGNVVGILGTVQDITEQKRVEDDRQQTEKALRDSEARYKSLVSNIPGVVYRCLCNSDWTELFISDFAEHLTGYPASDFLHTQVRSWASVIHPDDVIEPIVCQAVAARRPFELEYRVLHRDGSLRWVYEQGQGTVDEAGNVLYLDGVIFDISDRKRIEGERAQAQSALQQLNEELEQRVIERTAQLNRAIAQLKQEIVERQQAEIALREAAERRRDLERIINQSQAIVMMCRAEPGWPVNYVSDNVQQFGYTPADFYAQPCLLNDVIHPADLEQVAEVIAHYSKLGQATFTQEYRILTRDGEVRWVEDRTLIRQNDQGTITHYEGILIDISDRKRVEVEHQQAEENLRASQQRLSLLVQYAPLALLEWNTNLELQEWNPAAESIFGFCRDEVIGQQFGFIVPEPTRDAVRQQILAILTTELSGNHGITENNTKDGRSIVCEWFNNPLIAPNGEVVGLVSMALDITERRHAETALKTSQQLLQSVMDNIPQLIFWKDRQSVYLGCNRNFARVAGVGNPQNIVGKTDYDLPWTRAESDSFRIYDAQVMANDKPELHIIETQLQADGKHSWADTNKIPLHNAIGEVMGILGTYEDITERKQSEALLEQREAQFRNMAQREKLLNHLAGQIRNSLDVGTILETTVKELRRLLQVDRCSFLWYCPETEPPSFYRVHVAQNPELPVPPDEPLILNPDSASVQSFLRAEVIQIDNLATNAATNAATEVPTDTQIDSEFRRYLLSLGYVSHLSCPVQAHSGRLGVLACAHCHTPHAWQAEEIELFQAVANQLAIALDQAELYDQSRRAAVQAQAQAQKLEQTLRELQRTQAQMVQAEKMSSLGQLVAGVAHEINNPVSFIYGNLAHASHYTQDLLGLLNLYQQHYPSPAADIQAEAAAIDLDFLAEDLPKLLISMKVGADRIQAIVASLRTFSRMDEAEMKAVNIHEGIDSTLMILQSRLKAKPLRVAGKEYHRPAIHVAKVYGDLPLVECYAGQLNQVFMNILSNAIDAIDEIWEQASDSKTLALQSCSFTPQIQLATKVVEQNQVAIHIADNGQGIPEAVRRRLFDPFFTTKPIGKGTGMGLSISYQIIAERHGGSIQCVSEPEQGTEFIIQIPIQQQ